MKINLVKNGIFPIKNQTEEDSTGYGVSGTFQGEGKLLGTPCLFIRTSSCNLRCAWVGVDGNGSPCDSPYSSHKPEKNVTEIEEIIKIVKENTLPQNIGYVVVSGGEPTMQTLPLIELLKGLKDLGLHTTLETNATIHHEEISKYVDLVSMSPKLSSSTPWEANLKNTGLKFSERWAEKHENLRINTPVIQAYINGAKEHGKDFQLKFVVTDVKDIKEIENDFLSKLTGVDPSDVCLMPEGVTSEDLATRTEWLAQEALSRGWRFTPRLHILMFGKNRYV